MEESDGKGKVRNVNLKTSGGGVGIGGILETCKAEKAVWLMKCPALVSRSLDKNPSPDDYSRPIAKVILSIDPLNSSDDNSSHQFSMELTDNESGNAPKSYSLDMTEDFIPMSVFSESSQGKIAVEGKILHKFDMRPENLEKYANICRERTKMYMTKNRQIQVIDNDNGSHMRPMPLIMTSVFTDNKKKVPAKTTIDQYRRTRRDRGEIEDIMFKLFERQPNWTLKNLVKETRQPEQFMKDILKDLCVYNNKGTNQGSYELKPEYKKSCEDPSTASLLIH